MADNSRDGSEKDRDARTVRELRPAGSPGDTMPDITGQYVPPRPLPEVSEHRTLDLRSVRISDQADPRRALTERRLESPARVEPGGSSAKWWLVGGLTLLLGVWAWVFFGAEQSPKAQAPEVPAPATTIPVPAAPPRAAASIDLVTAAPLPISSTGTGPVPPSEPAVTRAGAPPAASNMPKAQAPRESEKKRRDPWAE